jgi:hypothetical protein
LVFPKFPRFASWLTLFACLGSSTGLQAQPQTSNTSARSSSATRRSDQRQLAQAGSGTTAATRQAKKPTAPAPRGGPQRPAPSVTSAPSTTEKGNEPAPAQIKKARDLWYKGVDAFRNGNYDEARLAFAECYALMPKSDVLRNLSISEIQSGHYVSAARHLTLLLAAPGELSGKVREEAAQRLAQAEAEIGQLSISVDVPGAEIAVDGAVVGRSPLEGNWYIEPGQHEVTVSKPGYPSETRQVFALAGVAIPVNVSLEELRRERANDEQAAQLMGTREGEALVARDNGDQISTASTVVLVSAGAIAAASLAAGIVFTVAANGHDSEAEGLEARIGGRSACRSGTPFVNECAIYNRDREDAQTDRNRAVVGFVGFGVASAATLGYALWLALEKNDSEPAVRTGGITPSLSVAPGHASVGLRAQF